MGSREEILKAVREGRPDRPRVGAIEYEAVDRGDVVATFESSLSKNGGRVHAVESMSQVRSYVEEVFGAGIKICSVVDGVEGTCPISVDDDPHTLADVDVAVVPGKIGVAENGAVWFTDDILVQRVLPFITQHLVVVLDKNDVVATMHDAYQKINMKEVRYGIFIAGPSKTADIEQSLVIGAHGARSHTVVWICPHSSA